MTTTLRPTAPEQRAADGHRRRGYEICVNGRPVGDAELATQPRFGPQAGSIERLFVREGERRRGRGTVAALAAEEVLRGWGCHWVGVEVPAGDTATLGLVTALGYTERSRNMAKPLTAPPALPAGSEARPMDDDRFPAWLAEEKAGYVESLTERGVPRAEAEAKCDADHAALLPRGTATPGVALRVLAHEGADVGTLWLSANDGMGYVFDVKVAPEHRRKGHGRTLMLVAEREALALGHDRVGLNVFAGNTPALRLYESLGYATTNLYFHKTL
ncbi:GNAT family N-acetyltransferase [Streptomyces mobaraensis]|uniref:GNAT family N-acetyltransferase n=1 Tax=Streptomyces mobaraensis TaxID=35621 RepID=A0A5N5VZL2_STRMB|nr:GNAT family N-acetyltransferase [Streptomyces mobaraensis]KAB7833629.1 GNAT family N-acetyltransferase [Streptomyces mobaraensis]